MTTMITMMLLAAVCLVFRLAFITLIPVDRLPAAVTRGLNYLAPAVLAAIAAVELTGVVQAADLVGNLATSGAMGLVALVAYRWRNLSLTVIAGLAAILIIDLVILR